MAAKAATGKFATLWRAAAGAGLLALLVPTTAGLRETLEGPVPARVIEVLDGDTVVVRVRIWLGQDVRTRVRLAGVDAPELKGQCARERVLARAARDFLARRIGGGPVILRDVRYGKYAGRVVARMESAAGEDMGAALIAAGLARPYAGGRRGSWCRQAVAPGGRTPPVAARPVL